MATSRREYQEIARTLKGNRPTRTTSPSMHLQWQADVRAIAIAFSTFNANFNFEKFYEACGLDNSSSWAAADEQLKARPPK